jgi:hypothetical protein
MALMQQRVADFVKDTPVNVDVWKEVAGHYVDMAMEKAKASIIKTFAELAKMPASTFTLLAVNNDRLPVLELLALPLGTALKIPGAGEVVEMRFEGFVDERDVRAKLLYAAHGTLA